MAVKQGYFLIALGKQYIDECVKLVETIRKQGDARPVALLVHPEDGLYASEKNMFQAIYGRPAQQVLRNIVFIQESILKSIYHTKKI